MNYTTINLTDSTRNENPNHKDLLQHTYNNGTIIKKYFIVEETIPETTTARQWRDSELSSTDNVAQTPDYPNRDAILAYRQELRDWPSTDAFPETKPIKP